MEAFIKIFERDLNKLKTEISSFENEDKMWMTAGEIKNSSGNLCLHLIGNLNHFIGAVIGNTGYVRNREAEFNDKNIDKKVLIDSIDNTKSMVSATLKNFDPKKLTSTYPIRVFNEDMSYEFFLIHLATHLNYHMGQINYLRRILETT